MILTAAHNFSLEAALCQGHGNPGNSSMKQYRSNAQRSALLELRL